jgi:hypothetical protein
MVLIRLEIVEPGDPDAVFFQHLEQFSMSFAHDSKPPDPD